MERKTTQKPKAKPAETAKKKTRATAPVAEKAKAAPAAKPVPPVKKKKKSDRPAVLYVAAEVNPFSQTGGLGEVASSLPVAVNALGGAEMAIVSPLYGCITPAMRENFEFVCHIDVPVAWRRQYAGLFRTVYRGVIHYFIDNEYYFKRDRLYGYYDDAERFAFFNRAVLELMPYMDFQPNILHANDWHTALLPIYYKLYYMMRAEYADIKTVVTIHNIEYQGQFDGHLLEDVFGISGYQYFTLEWGGCVNLLFGAIAYSDLVSTVSETYARELRTPEHACGLQDAIVKYEDKMTGILNGIDTEVYNPATAKALFAHYSAEDPSGKAENKLGLQTMLGLPKRADVPMITMVSRLAAHKGLDILKPAMAKLVKSEDLQFVILGTGESEYEGFFTDLQMAYPDKVRALIMFNKDMSQRLFAAGDIYLMPSRSEPCGLGQMMAMRYGTVPVVRNVGGLNDTVHEGANGNGFVAEAYTEQSLTAAIGRALRAYGDRTAWAEMIKRDMTEDWSWSASAKKYLDLYRNLLKK